MNLLCHALDKNPPKLIPARPIRTWMDQFPGHHPYKCLPMAIANSFGWELLSPASFLIFWNGGPNNSDIRFSPMDDYFNLSHFVMSNFSRGIVTFHTSYLFRTPPGWNLVATGPFNQPKDGMSPLTGVIEGDTIITGLVDDLLAFPDKQMNEPFKNWKKALKTWNSRSEIEFRKLSFGDDDAFDFFNTDDMKIQVLGPLLTKKGSVEGLKFLGNPPKGPRIGHDSLETTLEGFKGFSASHTINGHSIVFRLKYGGFGFLFCGDLNDEASRILANKHQEGTVSLRSEVFKVPHHGSADFSGALLQRVSPIISVVSSGDESARKEYIHPRATIMGALGKFSRVDEPLIFVTELVAFFQMEGYAKLSDEAKAATRGEFFAFSRAAYGIVKIRTDGKRLLVYTDSGKTDMKEAYAYQLDENGLPTPSAVVQV